VICGVEAVPTTGAQKCAFYSRHLRSFEAGSHAQFEGKPLDGGSIVVR
jgi:hypothetical protein